MNRILRTVLTLDLRALALLRMAVALVILLDLCIRITDLEVFYSDNGVIPTNLIRNHYWSPGSFSFHMLSGALWLQGLLFLLSAVAAALLFIGYRTRLVTFLSWILMVSLHNRNPVILQGGDDLLRMMLFWGLFLPWGRKASVDSRIEPASTDENSVVSLATLAYILQICYVYTTSALEKGPEWSSEFTALYYVYHLDQINYELATWLSQFPSLLRGLTAGAYYFELLVPLLLLFPFKNKALRMAGIWCIVLFHAWNGLSLQVGLFFVIGICSSLGLLPAPVIHFMEKHFKKSYTGLSAFLTLMYNGLSKYNLANSWSRYAFTKPTYGRWRDGVLIVLIYYVLAWNWGNLPFATYRMASKLTIFGRALRLDQNWGMFAPGVIKDDGWYIYAGTTTTGDTLDLNNKGKQVSYAKPEHVVRTFKNDRWRKYGEHYMLARNGHLRSHLCHYQLKKWNTRHPEKKIRQLQIIYMMEFTLPDYQYKPPTREILYECVSAN